MEQSIVNPDLDDLLAESRNAVFSNMNCVQIGQIEKVNDNQTCEIQIQFKRRISETETIDYPLLVDCPYFVLSGGGSYIDMPITKGDYCIILFNDRNIDDWWDTANIKKPRTRRKHDLSDGIALVGISPQTKTFALDGSSVRILGTSGEGAEEFAARQNDDTTVDAISDSAFITWIATVSTFINGLAPGLIPNPPTSVAGKITSGSTEVKIG